VGELFENKELLKESGKKKRTPNEEFIWMLENRGEGGPDIERLRKKNGNLVLQYDTRPGPKTIA